MGNYWQKPSGYQGSRYIAGPTIEAADVLAQACPARASIEAISYVPPRRYFTQERYQPRPGFRAHVKEVEILNLSAIDGEWSCL